MAFATSKNVMLLAMVSALAAYPAIALPAAETLLTQEFWKFCATSSGRIDHSATRAKGAGYNEGISSNAPTPERFTEVVTMNKAFEEVTVFLETYSHSNETQFATLCRTVQAGDRELGADTYSFVQELAEVFQNPRGGKPTMLFEGAATWVLSDQPHYSAIVVTSHGPQSENLVSIAYVTQSLKN